MSKTALRVVMVAMVGMGLHAQSASAQTVVVGDAACHTEFDEHYSTIQAAVNAVPDASTVIVCPGTYPEQVTITKPLTLIGVIDNNQGAAVITVPQGGLAQKVATATNGLVAAQVLVQNTNNVSISNLAIDGTGGGCPTAGGYDHVVGIEISNVGDASIGGAAISRVSVRNLTGACQLGVGLHAENSGLTVDSNKFRYIDGVAIIQNGGDGSITSNSVFTGSNGIVLHGVTSLPGVSVAGNVISTSGAAGITLEAGTTHVNVQNNKIGPYVGFGIFLDHSSGNTVVSNQVDDNWAGVLLYFSGQNALWSNIFQNLGYIGIWDEFSSGGNTVNSNTVNDSPIGVVAIQTADDDLSGNNLANVATASLP
jgi:parallel beta-helix repeat protein